MATAVGCIPEVIEEGVTGLLVPPNNTRALAEAIEGVLCHRQERDRMVAAARERAHDEFTARRMAERYDMLFRQLAGGRRT